MLTSRSGVYHPSNYQTTKDRARLPQRGSHAPGTFWYYNNWDFNALGTIYEHCTQTRIFEEFDRCVARPLQMQDYRMDDMRYMFQEYSLHPSYSFCISARDLARFGLLYLRQGRWRGQSIVPQPWVHVSTATHAQTPTGPGFGCLWWVCSSGHLFYDMPLPDGSYASYGFGGQYLLVIPSLDAVVVHLGDPGDPDYRPPTVEQACHLLQLILNASPVRKKQLFRSEVRSGQTFSCNPKSIPRNSQDIISVTLPASLASQKNIPQRAFLLPDRALLEQS